MSVAQWAGAGLRLPPLSPAVPAKQMLDNMWGAFERGLPQVKVCKPHGHALSIAGGGPSLKDTADELTGYVAAINGSLRWLLDNADLSGKPLLCGVLDAGPHIADALVADKNVRYYVASICDPAVFDKLKDCQVILWHPTPQSTEAPGAISALLNSRSPGWLAIGGGCTMGLRWLNLGYVLGFRKFNLHGMDSSFRNGATHAYPDRADAKDRLVIAGRETRANFVAQVSDFFDVVETFKRPELGLVEINVFGDGLLQDEYRRRQC